MPLTNKLTHYAGMSRDFNTEFMEIATQAGKLYILHNEIKEPIVP